MTQFKPGEVVVCVDARGVYLTEGKRYKVNLIRDNGLVDIINDRNQRQGYTPKRFKRSGEVGK
ncbi:hypothetical protein DRN74_05250 [Candidatus Micrarchaeota archaeon]|nr:MAG: hypothetical protein DRN74_05250 [Candidatus Micrarchaeota archaeon]